MCGEHRGCFECRWRLLVAILRTVTMEKTICAKPDRRIEPFLIVQNLNIKQVAHSLVVIEVEIVIHTRVGREAQQGEDCRNKNKLVCKQRRFRDRCKGIIGRVSGEAAEV